MERGKLEQRALNIRGLKTAWLEGGNPRGSILLFLHGYPDTPESWSLQFAHFAEDYFVIAPYSRGVYPSATSTKSERFGCPSMALDVMAILRIVNPDSDRDVYIVGHDLGAALAWYLAPMIQPRLKAMAIINGLSVGQMAGRFSELKQHMRSWYVYLFQLPLLPEKFIRLNPGKFVSFAYRKAQLPAPQRPLVQDAVKGLINPINQYRAHVKNLLKAVTERVPRVKAPVLVIWGEDDPFVRPPSKREIAVSARAPKIRILKGSHWVHREQPDLINGLIDSHFDNNKVEVIT